MNDFLTGSQKYYLYPAGARNKALIQQLRAYSNPVAGLRGLARILLAEFIHAASGIHDFLFAGEKWMTTGTNFHVQISTQSGACDEAIATAASDGNFLVFRVDAGFHDSLWFEKLSPF